MQHAPNTTPTTLEPGRVQRAHGRSGLGPTTPNVICVVDVTGAVHDRFDITHTDAGLRTLTRRLTELGCTGRHRTTKRPRRPGAAGGLDNGRRDQSAPGQNLRSRYGSAGNTDDSFDAYVLADTLRTDRGRLRTLVADSRVEPAKTSSRPASAPPNSSGPTFGSSFLQR